MVNWSYIMLTITGQNWTIYVQYNHVDRQEVHWKAIFFNYMSFEMSELQTYVFGYVKVWSETQVFF